MAKTSSRKTYYWDSCSFICWVDGGKGHPAEAVAGLCEIAREVGENRATLITSVITETEVLEGKLTEDQAKKFQELFKRRNVKSISVDSRIAKKASQIRSHYNAKGIKLSSPDCIHLATALIYAADELHTLDRADLLRLNGDVAGEPLHIRIPIAKQPTLFNGVESAENQPKPTGGNSVEESKRPAEPGPTGIQGSSVGPTEGQIAKGKEESGEVKT